MPFDALAMAAMTDEVETAAGGRIQKIVQPSLHAIGLGVYTGGSRHWLLLSADARFARIQFSPKLARAFPTPSPFVMLLRKYLDGARIQSVQQLPCERVMTIHCRGSEGDVFLVGEVMGKHSNIMLLDAGNRILGAVKVVRPAESRVRPIGPGRQYSPPPQQGRDLSLYPPGDRIDPAARPDAAVTMLNQVTDVPVRRALMGLLPGCGPFLADQIAAGTEASPETSVGEVGARRLVEAARPLFNLYRSRAWEPSTFVDGRGRADFSPFRPRAVSQVRELQSLSAAISAVVEDAESHDALGTVRNEALRLIERALHSAERRVESLEEGLAATGDAETYMTYGQMVLAYAYSIGPEQTELVLPEMEMVIPLDPALTPAANAERLFRRYRKLRDARERIPSLLKAAHVEVDRLHDLAAFARFAGSEGELRDLLNDMQSEPAKQKSNKSRHGPLRFSRDGFTAIVGRNARENEEVTFRLAGGTDLWLHARERTGAHVVLQGPAEPDDNIMSAAAELAAHFSEARADTAVDVLITSVRDVRKVPGGPPGRVTHRNARTIRVRPTLESWTRDR
jgi:predicted ribosome quality control (RQC) complex YloA/Tae2 family protein